MLAAGRGALVLPGLQCVLMTLSPGSWTRSFLDELVCFGYVCFATAFSKPAKFQAQFV